MKTYDTTALIKKLIDAHHPEGSVSKRDVIMTIPMDADEEKIQKINSIITAAIYKQTEDFIKSHPIKKPTGRFSYIARDLIVNDNLEARKEYNQQLTQAVIDAVNMVRHEGVEPS